MSRLHIHPELHLVARIGWLRAAVLGANDGIVSTASLIVGVAAAGSGRPEVLIAGLAGLVAGAMSMAAGDYVSVSSQADTEQADLARERAELATQPEFELEELTSATTFAVGAALPLGLVLVLSPARLVLGVSAASLLFLALLGAVGARAGGASVGKAMFRVTFWGALAMALTAGIGTLFGVAV